MIIAASLGGLIPHSCFTATTSISPPLNSALPCATARKKRSVAVIVCSGTWDAMTNNARSGSISAAAVHGMSGVAGTVSS
jgi:hypothetical protein